MASDSPLDLSRGWYARPRALSAWPLYQSLGALGRRLVDVLLERARWKPGEVWIAGSRVELQVGQLIDSEEELARLCGRGVTRKVVRTALHRLAEGGFLDRRPALPAGQCPYVITILDYASILPVAATEGPQAVPPEGQARANEGPSVGPAGAPVEQREHREHLEYREPGDPPPPLPMAPESPGGSRKSGRVEGRSGGHQGLIDAFCRLWLEVRGGDRYQPKAKDGAAVKRLLKSYPAAQQAAEVEARVRRYLVDPWAATNGGLAHFCERWAGLDGAVAPRNRPQAVPPRAPALDEEPPAGCDAWGRAREVLRDKLRPDLYARWFARLTGREDGERLVLSAPDRFAADFLRDQYQDLLSATAGREVVLEAP